MPYATASGVRLYYEEVGSGTPVVFVHEFAGDYRTWEPQLRRFARNHQCVTFSQRGYLPSDVPVGAEAYDQGKFCEDVIELMDALGIARAHIVGHSMGAYTALHVGLRYPERAFGVVAAGCGWGSNPSERDASAQACEQIASMFRDKPIAEAAAAYARYPMRRTFEAKDPRGFGEFERWLAEHSGQGSAMTMLNLQLKRPTLWGMAEELGRFAVPLLVVVGDEDEPCLDGSLFLKRTVPTAALSVLPRCGHTLTSEEPAAFNAVLEEFFASVEAGAWLAHKASK